MPPLSLSGFSPTTQIGAILYKIIRRSRGETIGTRIDCYRSLFMSLVRGRKNPNSSAHLYFTSSSAFAFSPPCGSCSVFEVAHTVYKNASNWCPFGCGCPTHNCNEIAISLAQSANITVAKSNNITHAMRAYHLHCCCGSHFE